MIMKQKHTFCFLLFILFCMSGSVASAHDFEATYNDKTIYYNITSDETVEVTYQGDDYYSYDNEYEGSIAIPQSVEYDGTTYSVTVIGQLAFADCTEVTSVEIPNSVTSIGNYAFSGCYVLTSIEIPNTVTSIGEYAFQYCGLSSIEIPNSVTTIGGFAFSFCQSLTNIEIPSSVNNLGVTPFNGCSGLTSIAVASGNTCYDSRGNCNAIIETSTNTLIAGCRNTVIPNTVTAIGEQAFYCCYRLSDVEIPNSVNSIGAYAFSDCSALTSIEIPNSVTAIGQGAFRYCSDMESIVVANGNSYYDSRENCNAIIETSTNTLIAGCRNSVIPNTILRIGDYAFQGCSYLQDTEIPNSVISIGKYAFWNCNGLTNVVIPNSVTTIENYAFTYCYGLTSVDIPSSVTTIGNAVFYYCQRLADVYCHASQVPATGYEVFTGISSSATLHVPSTSLNAYSNTAPWSDFGTKEAIDGEEDPDPSVKERLENWESTNHDNSTTDSHTYEFTAEAGDILSFDWYVSSESGYDKLTITLDGTVLLQSSGVNGDNYQEILSEGTHTLVASYSKDGSVSNNNDNAGIRNIVIKSNEGSITFACEAVKAVCVDNWDTNGDGELSYKEAATVTTIGTSFQGNKAITSFNELKFFKALTEIGNEAFSGCWNMASITFPNSLTSIGNNAFQDNSSLTSIKIPASVNNIGNYAFTYCSLTSVEIPNSVTSIGISPFMGNNLSYITVAGDNPVYDSRNYCNAIIERENNNLIAGCKNTVIPNNVTSIGDGAFYGCPGLSTINIPSSVTSIGAVAFVGTSLESVEIPNSVTSIGSQAFTGCERLKTIKIPNSMTNIDIMAFQWCISLTDVYCLAGEVPSTSMDAFYDTPISSVTLHVPYSALDAYSNTSPWSGFGSIVPIDEFEEGDSTLVILERKYLIEWGNNYSYPNITLSFDNGASIQVGYYYADYWNSTYDESIRGIHLFSNSNGTTLKDLLISNAVTGEWVKEKLVVSEKGIVMYYMDDQLMDVAQFDELNLQDADELDVTVSPYGWWTEHKQYMDDFTLTTPRNTISDDFNDGSLDLDIWEQPVNADGVREEDGVVKMEQLRTDEDFCLRIKTMNLRSTIALEKQFMEDWESTNHDHGSTDSYTWEFTVDEGDKLSFDWYVSSEEWCDILTVILDGNTILQNSGVKNGTFKTTLTAGYHNLTAWYSKDGSVSNNNDNAGIRNIVIKGYYDVPEGNIEFADTNVKALCVENWDRNGDGEISYLEALFVKDLGTVFYEHTEITSFDELQYFIGLQSVGEIAFYYCSSLTSVKIPKSVTSIAPAAFMYCRSLTSIEIPKSVSYIGNEVIYGCSSLESIVIDADNPYYDSRNNCNAIIETWSNTLLAGCKNSIIPNTVSSIKNNAFALCEGLTSIEIPNSVNYIGDDAFIYCTSLTSIEIPYSVYDLGDYAFAYCSSLTSAELSENIWRLGDFVFYGCSALTSIEIPYSVTTIGHCAFQDCVGLTEIELPASVTSIGNYAFSGCDGLTNLDIPNSVTSIGIEVFNSCDALEVINWTPNAETVAGSPLASSNCTLYLFKDGTNNDKTEELASLFDGQLKAVYVVEGILELTAFASEEYDDYGNYYCTYYDPNYSLMIIDGEAQAFTATYDEPSITLHAVEDELVYPDNPIIFRTTEPVVTLYLISNITGTNTTDNDLLGTREEMTVSRSDKVYVLFNGGFYITEGTIPAHKAYLDLSSVMTAPERLSFIEGGTTLINNAEDADDDPDGPWYSVNGQRVDKPTKGIFIKNGKKYLFK